MFVDIVKANMNPGVTEGSSGEYSSKWAINKHYENRYERGNLWFPRITYKRSPNLDIGFREAARGNSTQAETQEVRSQLGRAWGKEVLQIKGMAFLKTQRCRRIGLSKKWKKERRTTEIICFHSSVYPSSLIAETLFYCSKIESLYFRVCPFSAYYNEHLLTLLNILLKQNFQ